MEEFFLLNRFFNNRAERDPDRVAVYEYDSKKAYTYRELAARSSRLASFLAEHDVRKGDRVASFCRNSQPCIDILYAMPITGAILTTYNVRLRGEELEQLFRAESPSVVFYEAFFAEKIRLIKQVLPGALYVVLDEEENPLGDIRYSQAMECAPWEGKPCDIGMEDILMLCHTGGTTGTPKAAMISYRSLFFNTFSQITEYSISPLDKIYVSYPLFHISAWSAALSLLTSGGCLVFKRDFDTEETLRMIETEKLTFLNGSPAVYQRMALSPRFAETDFSSIRFVRCGAAPPPIELISAYTNKGLKFIDAYGMTESGTSILSIPLGTPMETIKAKAGSAGKAMLFSTLRIVDEDGNDVPQGVHGELLVKGEMLFSGYWKNEKETENVMDNGWLHTGDMAYLDADGFYNICGRKKHMFISLGENIFPLEIENFLSGYPEIADSYVFGVPDHERGEVGKAIIVLREGCELTEDEVTARMKGKLSTLKIPRYVQFVPKVPRNEVGKVQTRVVEELYGLKGAGI